MERLRILASNRRYELEGSKNVFFKIISEAKNFSKDSSVVRFIKAEETLSKFKDRAVEAI